MSTTLRITDGTTTADLIFNTSTNRKYQLCEGGWAPAVAGLRRSTLGGAGPYEDVVEEININVWGASPAEALANLAALSQLLDQAERWARGEVANAVQVLYQPEGASQLLSATILGRDDRDAGGLALPAGFSEGLFGYVIEDVRLRFRRSGQWLATGETGYSTAVEVCSVATVTLSACPLPSPTHVRFEGDGMYPLDVSDPGFLLIANDPTSIKVLNAAPSAAAPFSVVADAGNHALGNVLRYTPTGVAPADSPMIQPSLSPALARPVVAVFAAIRNNSASVTWQVRANFVNGSHVASTPFVTVDAAQQTPRLFCLGTLVPVGRMSDNGLTLSCIASTILGGPTLDINYVTLLVLRPGDGRAIAVRGAAKDSQSMFGVFSNLPVPLVGAYGAYDMDYAGDAYVTLRGTSLAACWLQTAGSHWRLVDESASAIYRHQVVMVRQPGYLTPQ